MSLNDDYQKAYEQFPLPMPSAAIVVDCEGAPMLSFTFCCFPLNREAADLLEEQGKIRLANYLRFMIELNELENEAEADDNHFWGYTSQFHRGKIPSNA